MLAIKDKLNSAVGFFQKIRYLRYLAVLYYGMKANFAKEYALKKRKEFYFDNATLQRIGDFIGLDYDCSKSYKIVFKDSISREEIKKIRDEKGKEYFTLTQKGIKTLRIGLEELRHIVSSPYLEQAIRECEMSHAATYITSTERQPVNPNVAILNEKIRKISRDLDIE